MILPRREIPAADWDAFALAHGGFVFHTHHWLDYELSWRRCEDHSFGVLQHGRLVAVVPLLVEGGRAQANGEIQPGALGEGWREPLQATGYTGVFRQQPTRTATDHGWLTRVVDTTLAPAVLWHDLRHSNRSLIRRAEERYEVIHGPLAGQLLHRLYDEQAGTLPVIPDAGWTAMWALAATGWLSFFAAIRREDGRCDGAIGVYHAGDWSYYGAGRSVVPNVNHLLQWHVLTHPVARYYELGWHARPGDDDKAHRIAFGKQGYGGDEWWVPTWAL